MHANATSSPRRATVEKLKRDTANLKAYARFVLVLKESGVVVIDNGFRKTQGLPYAKIIAVLGPAHYDGEDIPEGNLLEIGYSRTRPYASTELSKGERSHHRRFLKQRPRARSLSAGEMTRIHSHIVECMRTIVLELSAHWTTRTWCARKKPGYAKGPEEFGRGIYFTVHHSDRLLHKQFSLEDVRHRKDRYLLRHASWIRCLFREYASSQYTPKQLKSFARARRVVEMLSQDHYTPFYRTVLCRHFEEGSHERVLLDSIMKAFNIDVSVDEHGMRILESEPVSLPLFENLRCYRISDQPTVHARGATVFEIFLEREYRLSLEERSCREAGDDEAPF